MHLFCHVAGTSEAHPYSSLEPREVLRHKMAMANFSCGVGACKRAKGSFYHPTMSVQPHEWAGDAWMRDMCTTTAAAAVSLP